MISSPNVDVAVFAYNEEQRIERALRSLCSEPEIDRITVLVNGCSDETASIVAHFASSEVRVELQETDLGDKCFVWNRYVHELARPESAMHVFMDGDCYCEPGAIHEMLHILRSSRIGTAAAAVPYSGRNRHEYIQLQHKMSWLFGNLYGVRTEHLMEVRRLGIRLPIGLKGNDHFITKIMQAPLPDCCSRKHDQIVVCDRAGYRFDSLQPYRVSDVQLYWRRRVTYCLRQKQIPLLNSLPLDELPVTVDDVNRKILAELNSSMTFNPEAIAIQRKLARMYPQPDSRYYEERFIQASPSDAVTTGVRVS